MNILKRLLVALSLVVVAASASAAPIVGGELMPLRHLVHAVGMQGNPNFYGSATAFQISDGKAYFLTNDHVIPGPSKRNSLYLRGTLTGDQVVNAVEVVGTAPGLDLAVLAVNVRDLNANAVHYVESLLPYAFRGPARPSLEGVLSGLIGVRGIEDLRTGRLGHSRFTWEGTNSIPKVAAENAFDETLPPPGANPFGKLTDLVEVEVTSACPSYSLRECFLVRARSWGYSGGIFYQFNKTTSLVEIAGIVSHYRFLLPDTYVIPIRTALAAGRRIIGYANPKSTAPMNFSLRASFSDLSRNTAKVVRGSLAGKTVSSLGGLTVTGGGDVVGGGGDVVGGGGDVVGGGGDVVGGGGDSFFGSSSLKLPRVLNFAGGLRGFLAYRAGVAVDGTLAHSWLLPDGKLMPADSLADFMSAYEAHPEGRPSPEFKSEPLPQIAGHAVGMRVKWEGTSTRTDPVLVFDITPDIDMMSFGINGDDDFYTEFLDKFSGQLQFRQDGWDDWSARGPYHSHVNTPTNLNLERHGNIQIWINRDAAGKKYFVRILRDYTGPSGNEVREMISLEVLPR